MNEGWKKSQIILINSMILHDTHYHLDLSDNPTEMVLNIERAKVYTIAVTNTPSVFFYTQEITQNSKYVRAALGLHPELAAQRKNEISLFYDLINQTRYIGEIGLDNYNKSSEDYSIQKSIFNKILTLCAEKKNKIITIHSRKATSDVISMIGNNFEGKVILHWYSGGIRDLETAIKYGFYFSINYPMTISESGKRIIERLPIDKILLETDGPFTSFNSTSFSPIFCDKIYINILKNNKLILPNTISENFKNLIL